MVFKFRLSFAAMLVCAALALLAAASPARAQGKPMVLLGGGSDSFLGVNVKEVDAARAKEISLKDVHGVEITQVAEASPADKAGLRVFDVVLDYQGQRVEGTQQFVRLVQETPVGRQVRMTVFRNGSNQTLTAEIGTRTNQLAKRIEPFRDLRNQNMNLWIPDVPRAFTSWRSSALGVEAEGVEGQLASYFGVERGTLVRSVVKGSPADKVGIRAGDVILKVDDEEVSNPRELSNALRSNQSKKSAVIGIMRDRKQMNVTVNLEDQGTGSILPRTQSIRGPA